jgi:hypothetical protein
MDAQAVKINPDGTGNPSSVVNASAAPVSPAVNFTPSLPMAEFVSVADGQPRRFPADTVFRRAETPGEWVQASQVLVADVLQGLDLNGTWSPVPLVVAAVTKRADSSSRRCRECGLKLAPKEDFVRLRTASAGSVLVLADQDILVEGPDGKRKPVQAEMLRSWAGPLPRICDHDNFSQIDCIELFSEQREIVEVRFNGSGDAVLAWTESPLKPKSGAEEYCAEEYCAEEHCTKEAETVDPKLVSCWVSAQSGPTTVRHFSAESIFRNAAGESLCASQLSLVGGDLLDGPDGLVKVQSVSATGSRGDFVRIRTKMGSIMATPEHLLLVEAPGGQKTQGANITADILRVKGGLPRIYDGASFWNIDLVELFEESSEVIAVSFEVDAAPIFVWSNSPLLQLGEQPASSAERPEDMPASVEPPKESVPLLPLAPQPIGSGQPSPLMPEVLAQLDAAKTARQEAEAQCRKLEVERDEALQRLRLLESSAQTLPS